MLNIIWKHSLELFDHVSLTSNNTLKMNVFASRSLPQQENQWKQNAIFYLSFPQTAVLDDVSKA